MKKKELTNERYEEIFGELGFAFYMDESRDYVLWDDLMMTILNMYPKHVAELHSCGYTYGEILQLLNDYLS